MPQPRLFLIEGEEGLRCAKGFRPARWPEAETLTDPIRNAAFGLLRDPEMLIPIVHLSSLREHVTHSPRVPVITMTCFPESVMGAGPSHRPGVKAMFTNTVDPMDVAASGRSRCREQ